jgi:alkaline phosphatase D
MASGTESDSRLSRRVILGVPAIPAVIRAESARPAMGWGVQSGDPRIGRAGASMIAWSRTDRPARLMVEWSTRADMRGARVIAGPAALEVTGYTARVELPSLPAGAEIFYRAHFVSLADGRTPGAPVSGMLRTPPDTRKTVRFLWSGDTCGQGYGSNPDWGGMRIYETMRALHPDFFIHSGDTIYADNPIPPEIRLPSGELWRNVVTEAKSRVAETLDDFRGNYLYNLMDANVRRFNAEVPQVWQWDDHEVLNNWSPSKDLTTEARYREKSIFRLAAGATRAFQEFAPLRPFGSHAERIYRRIPYGPLLDVFVVDMRSYRGPNTFNRQEHEGPETAFLGQPQFDWLLRGLTNSKARWKVIAADMPIGLLVADGKDAEGRPQFEAIANGGGPALGRELEFARLLAGIKRNGVKNTLWLTADVHYTAAHHYSPDRAIFTGFDPFWEFVSGPLNAGTFGPGTLDNTFGPEAVFVKAPPRGQSNLPPSAGYQFFGEVEIDGKTGALTVRLRDLTGAVLYTRSIDPSE